MKEDIFVRFEKIERELFAKAKKQNDKKEKFRALANIIDYSENGNRARQLVNIVAREYEKKPQELTKYFSNKETLINSEGDVIDPKVDGIARSAYMMLTQDFRVIQNSEFAGFGITINTSPKKLTTTNNQFKYAKLTGDALQNSVNKENALQHSMNFDNSLKESKNYDRSLWNSVNFDETLRGSRNFDHVLWNSKNFDNSLKLSRNYGESLWGSANFDSALQNSKNYNESLSCSQNGNDSLQNSRNYGRALRSSKNFENTLQKSRNYDEALMMSKNFDNTGMHSRNRPNIGKMAETHNDAFTNASLKKNSFLLGKHHGEFKVNQFFFNRLNETYIIQKKIRQERINYLARVN